MERGSGWGRRRGGRGRKIEIRGSISLLSSLFLPTGIKTDSDL